MRISDWSSDVCSSDLFHAGLQVMREVAVGGARTVTVGADEAGDVAHAPVAAAPLVVQRCAGFREALQPDLLDATVDGVPQLVAELQHVAQLAAGAEVEVEIGRAHV